MLRQEKKLRYDVYFHICAIGKNGDFDTIQSRHFMHVQSCVWGHNLLTNLKANGKLI